MTDERRYEKVKRDFTTVELTAFKDELARLVRIEREMLGDKAETLGRITAALKAVDLEIGRLSDQISTGFEWVDSEIIILLDQPQPGMKTLVRVDTGEEHRVEPMTADDRQRMLDLEEPKEQ